jgi:hypothetical protein
MVRISSRVSLGTQGRPAFPCRTFQVQYQRKPQRCQSITVAGFTITIADRHAPRPAILSPTRALCCSQTNHIQIERWSKVIKATLLASFLVAPLAVQQSNQTSTQAIAAAVLPLPETLRNSATVVRLNDSSQPEVLRKGTNGIVCIADKPDDARFDVRCYHETFIPVVYRAFQLGYQVSGPKVEEEIKAGKQQIPTQPTVGYRCLGPIRGYSPLTNSITSEIECWQSIHFPFRTANEIGLPEEAEVPADLQRTVPHVMSSGNYWSHVMIRHPNTK